MGGFTSTSQLKSAIISRMKSSVVEVETKIYKIVQDYLYIFYGEYQPVESIRKWDIFNSLVKTSVTPTGNGWRAEIYFDIGKLHHLDSYIGQSGMMVYKDFSEEKILKNVVGLGYHGSPNAIENDPAYSHLKGTKIWDKSMAESHGNQHEWFKQALLAAGIPVK